MVQPRLELSAEEDKSLTESIQRIIIIISCIIRSHAVANLRTIKGRLSFSFQSELFSPSGNFLIYMPGKPPRSNDADRWDVEIYSMVTHEDVLALIGHTDALMWTGYGPDETMIATVAWDQTIHIWDARCGHQKYKFDTNARNWTGGFSPDSKRFAGTCGDGTFYVYSLDDGGMLTKRKYGFKLDASPRLVG